MEEGYVSYQRWGSRGVRGEEKDYEKWEGTNLQILARISPLPVANNWPVGLGATEMTEKNQKR